MKRSIWIELGTFEYKAFTHDQGDYRAKPVELSDDNWNAAAYALESDNTAVDNISHGFRVPVTFTVPE